MNLQEFVSTVEKYHQNNRDYHAPASMTEAQDKHKLATVGDYNLRFSPNTVAHAQLSEKLGIPASYYNSLLHPKRDYLWAKNVNYWLHNPDELTSKQKFLLRTREDTLRAVLTPSYMFKENYDVTESILSLVMKHDDIEVVDCGLSEKRMYMRIIFHRLTGEVKVGDPIKGGIFISNSEVGHGAVNIRFFIIVLSCLNGMTLERVMREIHLGKRINPDIQDITYFRPETIEADNRAFRMRVEDSVNFAVSKDRFNKHLERFRNAGNNKLNTEDVPAVMSKVSQQFSLTQDECKGSLQKLIEGRDFSQWGLAMAVTNIAHQVDEDRKADLQDIGGKIIDLSESQWKVVNAV